ncbi:putative B3 domain-containing protein REM15 [Euphorbia lathyris]|uniref:putative B3 domain-containing protein REM15 n=1 Tax=Euphorbia lathyris TaxID=212925 RepID=UPI00331405F8
MSTLLSLREPHFFKPLFPGFEDDFLIPVAFFKYLNGHECEEAQATLRSRRGKLWPVKINGRRFGDGWKQFVQDHDLHIADFLVFKHEGDLVFYVFVFDRTTCEREYPPFPATQVENTQIQQQNVPIHTTTGKELEKRMKVECRLEAEARSSVLEHPYCLIKLTPDCFKSSKFHIPWKFAREHGLYGRCCSMILKDENGSCWPAKLLHKSSNSKTFVAGGWTAFHVAHKLKIGDSLIVELTRNGNVPVLKMRRLQEHPEFMCQNNAQATSSSTGHLHSTTEPSSHKESELKILEEEAKGYGSWKSRKNKQPNTASEVKDSSCAVQQNFFVTKVESHTSKLYIPEKFARLHFQDKNYSKVILVDRERRSWPTTLCDTGDLVYIEDGCNEFQIANKLKVGDSFVFECIEMGNKLAFKLYGFKTNHKYGMNQEKRCLYLTVLQSHVRNNQMRIPSEFARRNDLGSSITSEMTIMNEMGNSWQMTLKVDKCGGVYIRNGWTKFTKENGIKEGHVFMLEVLKGGTTPFMKYYATKQEMDSNQKVRWEDFEDDLL